MIYICENILDFDIEMALRAVSAERRERSLRYRFERDRRQSIAAYLLLKHGLMQEYGIDTAPDFSYSNGGKPHISTHLNIHFNMSHCQPGVACAISRYPIGIDIEAITEIEAILKSLREEQNSIDTLSERVARATELIALCRENLRKTECEINKIIEE